jgi:hypothetical protein
MGTTLVSFRSGADMAPPSSMVALASSLGDNHQLEWPSRICCVSPQDCPMPWFKLARTRRRPPAGAALRRGSARVALSRGLFCKTLDCGLICQFSRDENAKRPRHTYQRTVALQFYWCRYFFMKAKFNCMELISKSTIPSRQTQVVPLTHSLQDTFSNKALHGKIRTTCFMEYYTIKY